MTRDTSEARPSDQGMTMEIGAESGSTAKASDEALVALVGSGHEEALGALYERFGPLAYSLAVRIIRDRAFAEDVVQDGFLAIWNSARRYSTGQGSVRTWLLTIVHRRAVDVVRKQNRIRLAEASVERRDEQTGEETDEQAQLRADRRFVQTVLAQLKPEQREALELGYYGGLTQSQIARRLGQPLGTVKSRTLQGLARLRDLFELEPTTAALSGAVEPRTFRGGSSTSELQNRMEVLDR